jgi:hypothetical protein
LKGGGNVDERDPNGWTPLMHAALECRAEIMDLLLERGADAKVRGRVADSPAFVDSGQTALLLASGCFIARRRAALAPERDMPADYVGYELAAPARMVRALIAHGAAVNQADSFGRTPLMMAAMHGWVDAARVLLAGGASVNARDREGRLAIDYADPAALEMVGLLNKAGSGPATGRSGRSVCDAERALDMPIVDCIGGQQFGAAVQRFQRAHGLPATGELDTATRTALKIR